MFQRIEEQARPWQRFLLHSLFVVFLVPIVGLLNYKLTPFVGALNGFFATRKLQDHSAIYAWIPAFLLFALAASDPIRLWAPSWSHVTHWQYFTNTMFGPHCGDTECLYTVPTAVFTGGVGYSVASSIVLRNLSKPSTP
jgi:hypothetical protein